MVLCLSRRGDRVVGSDLFLEDRRGCDDGLGGEGCPLAGRVFRVIRVCEASSS